MTFDPLQIEKEEEDDVLGMISLLGKKVEVWRIHRTESGPLKLVLTRPIFWGKVIDHTQFLFFWF